MANFPQIQLRKNGGTLYMRIPLDFVRANNLKAGDIVMPDLSTFRILRQEAMEALCEEPEAVEAGLEPAE
jgi:antitoxin component of MazEF toxin-antitoxin module